MAFADELAARYLASVRGTDQELLAMFRYAEALHNFGEYEVLYQTKMHWNLKHIWNKHSWNGRPKFRGPNQSRELEWCRSSFKLRAVDSWIDLT